MYMFFQWEEGYHPLPNDFFFPKMAAKVTNDYLDSLLGERKAF